MKGWGEKRDFRLVLEELRKKVSEPTRVEAVLGQIKSTLREAAGPSAKMGRKALQTAIEQMESAADLLDEDGLTDDAADVKALMAEIKAIVDRLGTRDDSPD
jgi:hypothetical protein